MMKSTLAAMILALAPTGHILAGQLEDGLETYMRYCASCHGADADGNGPMRPVLMVQPTDLTALSAENGGMFPVARVVKRIDGRDPLVSHGSPMPVYGDFFDTGAAVALRTDSGQPVLTTAPLAELVTYLESVQRPAN